MLRIIAVALLGAYLIAIGIWPAALAPVSLAFAGIGAILGAVPGPVWLLAGGIAWLKHRPGPAKPARV